MRAVAIGVVIVAVHAAALPWAMHACRRGELTVRVSGPVADPERFSLVGVLPDDLATRVAIDPVPDGPGLHYRRWRASYRGGFTRQVGAAQLVGPFQTPGTPHCAGRLIVSQRLLDDGAAGPGTVAAVVKRELDANLRGLDVFPIGAFERVKSLSLAWARIEQVPEDRALIRVIGTRAPNGYIRVRTVIAFDRVDVPITVALIPEMKDGALSFDIRARAELDFDNRVLNWANDVVGGNGFATRIAQEEIDKLIVSVLEPPPPIDVPGGRKVTFAYCGEPPIVTHGSHVALPLGVAIAGVPAAPSVLPPRLGAFTAAPPPSNAAPITLDLELDALNALLYELWRTSYLDEQLDAAQLDDRFNHDPTVATYLSLRISPLRLSLPPVLVAAGGDRLRMSGDLVVAIADGAQQTTGRVWSSLDFRFTPALAAAVDLGELDLSCEPQPSLLAPCYGDLVDALRARAPDVHDTLTRTFTDILHRIFVGQRLSEDTIPAELSITGVTPHAFTAGRNGLLRLELAATVVPK
jgi:hypothetical protein